MDRQRQSPVQQLPIFILVSFLLRRIGFDLLRILWRIFDLRIYAVNRRDTAYVQQNLAVDSVSVLYV